jgi:hypothetical protein
MILCGFAAAHSADNEPKEVPEGFEPLFNGKNLAGWKVFDGKMEAWGADDGLLYVKGGGGGWLMTTKEYADFEVRLEYRMPKMGNSGVAIRAPLQGNPAYQGMEIQLLDDANWKGLKPTQFCGSIYDVVPPSKHVTKPAGEWNKIAITATGRQITVVLNDTKIVDANLDDHKDRADKHPGILREKGHIGLQSYNFRVDFRNLYVKPL